MSTPQSTQRFILLPHAASAEGPPVRRYSLARLHASPRAAGDARFAYLKRTHD